MSETGHVAVIGIGIMGGAIANRLLGCGHSVTIYDPRKEQLVALKEQGAATACSPAEAANEAQHVITSLNTPEIVENVVFSSEGVIQAASSDKLLIDMSSIDPKSTLGMAPNLQTP